MSNSTKEVLYAIKEEISKIASEEEKEDGTWAAGLRHSIKIIEDKGNEFEAIDLLEKIVSAYINSEEIVITQEDIWAITYAVGRLKNG